MYRYAGDLAAGVDVPDDPRASQDEQYYLYGGEFGTMKGADVLNAWNRVAGGSDVTVAVFDSGCRLDHEDLAGTLLTDLAYEGLRGERSGCERARHGGRGFGGRSVG